MSQNIALITGITGMDGAHLAPLLLEKGYGDLTDSTSLIRMIQETRTTEAGELLGDLSKAHEKPGVEHKTNFAQLVREILDNDMNIVFEERNRRERHG